MYKALFLVLAGKSELEMYSGEENGGQSAPSWRARFSCILRMLH